MSKPTFPICKDKDADQLRGNLRAFVFAKRIVTSLFFLNQWLERRPSNPAVGGHGFKPLRGRTFMYLPC